MVIEKPKNLSWDDFNPISVKLFYIKKVLIIGTFCFVIGFISLDVRSIFYWKIPEMEEF